MWLAIIGLLFIAAPFVARSYLRRSTLRLAKAHGAWGVAEQHARVLLEDRHLHPAVGDFVEFTANRVGDGELTRTFLRSVLLKQRANKAVRDDAAELFSSLNREQEQQFFRFMVAAMFYDSLRTGVSGALLRRLLYWMAGTTADRTAPVNQSQVQPMVYAADKLCHA